MRDVQKLSVLVQKSLKNIQSKDTVLEELLCPKTKVWMKSREIWPEALPVLCDKKVSIPVY